MKPSLRIFSAIIFASLISSCAMVDKFNKPTDIDYLERGAKIDMKRFFNGDLEGFAITQDETGKITGTQTVKINGKWEENKGVVQYSVSYSDGKKDSRTWLITANDDGTFDAVGHDVAGPAKGKQVGNAAQMIYTLLQASPQGKKEVKFEERMYLVDDKSMIMVVNIKKGFQASGKSIVSIKKLGN